MRKVLAAVAVCTALILSTAGETRADSPFLMRGYRPGHIFGNTVRTFVWGPGMNPNRGYVASSRGYTYGGR